MRIIKRKYLFPDLGRLWRGIIGAAGLLAVAAAVWMLAPQLLYGPEPDERLRRQIGQMLMVGFRGASIGEDGPRILREQISRGEVGGVLYLGRNVSNETNIKEMNRAFLDAAGALPPFIAVDQEGGRIERLKAEIGFPATPSAQWFGINSDPAAARKRYALLARDLRDLHFNTNLGPVVDLDLDPRNPIISRLERSYSKNSGTVSAFAAAFVQAHREASLVTSLKHFPGHGSTILDSHRALPDISASWSPVELEPYRELLARDLADMVMVGHLALESDETNRGLPATLSPAIVTGLLRDELGFDGVVMSDDMDMGAITDGYRLEEAVIQAIRAGTDLVIVSGFRRNDPHLPAKLVRAVGREAMRDAAFRVLIEKSYERIAALKGKRFGAGRLPKRPMRAARPSA